MKNAETCQVAFHVANHISAMVAYWNADQTCAFANNTYRQWFGKSPEEMRGMSIRELVGPVLYERNRPQILAALKGERQVFERQIVQPDGQVREAIITYTPDIVEGVVRGFTTHIADVTTLREREVALEQAIRDRDAALAELKILHGLLPICGFCKSIRDENNQWQQLETYVSRHSEATFSHGVCPTCKQKHYGE